MTEIIDCHTHVFPPEVRSRRETYSMLDDFFADLYGDSSARIATAEDLLEEMDAAGVQRSVLCGFGWSSHELCVMHNDYLIDCLRRYPHRFSALASIQPLAGERCLAETERCLAQGMRGVGELMPSGQGFQLNEVERIGHLFQYAAQRGFVVMTHASEPVGHLYPGKESATPETLWPLIEAYPKVRLIMAHWGGGYPFYELMPEVRRASANIYYDSAASTYLYSPDIFVHLSRIVGCEKLLWATDFPILRQSRFLEKVRSLPLEEKEKEAILGGNAARLLGLTAPSAAHEAGEGR